MLKLLYIATNLHGSGGVSRVLSVKLNYLVEHYPYEIYIVNTYGNADKLFFKFNKKIHIQSLYQDQSNFKRFLTYNNKLNTLIKLIKPDIIINCDNGMKGALLPFLLKERIPLIYEYHTSGSKRGGSVFKSIKLQLASLFFLISKKRYERIIVLNNTKIKPTETNVEVIPNPLGFAIPERSASLEHKVAIAVGRFAYEKNYNMLVKIWSLVTKKRSDWILNIYGEGNYTNLETLAKRLDVFEKIKFFKPVNTIKTEYLNASLFLNTSREESFGLAITEAMSCGLPVILFDNLFGPKTYIKDKENGFLIEKDNITDYVNQIIALIDDKTEMKRVGDNAKESMKAYQVEHIMKKWHTLFKSI